MDETPIPDIAPINPDAFDPDNKPDRDNLAEKYKEASEFGIILPNKTKLALTKSKKREVLLKVIEKRYPIEGIDKLDNVLNIRVVYEFLTNGFNKAKIAKKLNIGIGKVNSIIRGRVESSIINTNIADIKYIKNEAITKLKSLQDVDIADFEDYLSGKKTLKELRAEGIDTSVIESVSSSLDKYGNPVIKIKLPSATVVADILHKMSKIDKENEKGGINNNIGTINIISNVPSMNVPKIATETDTQEVIDASFEENKDG
jgi:hypothetical protein